MTAILKAGLIVSLAGFTASLILHLLLAAGHPLSPSLLAVLFAGVFPLAAAITAVRIKIQVDEGDWVTTGWETLYSGVPIWARLVCAIAMINVFVAMRLESPPLTGLMVCFYAIFGALLYSVYRQPWLVSRMSCPNGHPVKYFNRFCPACGELLPRIKGRA